MDLVEPVIKIEDVSYSMYLFNSTICEIIDVIERLKPKHTCGIDEISNLFLVKSRYVLALYLTYLTYLSFCSGMFPQSLKFARVLPLHKADSRIIMTNYRPIWLFKWLQQSYWKNHALDFTTILKVWITVSSSVWVQGEVCHSWCISSIDWKIKTRIW